MKPEDITSFEKLFQKCQALLTENSELKKEVGLLKARLEGMAPRFQAEEVFPNACETKLMLNPCEDSGSFSEISNISDSSEKVRLFMSLFRGREDVYARRWENKKKGTSGYAPFCRNEWKPGICNKREGACAVCGHKDYGQLDETVIDDHLRGKIIAGIYPAALARKLGASMITYAMNRRHEITFKSYDRLFPNQDILPKGGLGNLIALPLQKGARKEGNRVFI